VKPYQQAGKEGLLPNPPRHPGRPCRDERLRGFEGMGRGKIKARGKMTHE